MNNFRTYNLAVQFYHQIKPLKLPLHLRDQLLRAASSIVLNLAEGAGRPTRKDQARFYSIAFASARECQAVLDLEHLRDSIQWNSLDTLAAHIYKLIKYSG